MTETPSDQQTAAAQIIKKYKSIVFILVAILCFSGLSERMGFSYLMRPFDDTASAYLEETLKSTATAFAAAKIINSSVSVLQSSQIGGGIGVSAYISPLKILEPFDKTIEQFSDAMLFVSAFCIIFDVLFQLGKLWGGGVILGVAMLSFFIVSISGKHRHATLKMAMAITILAIVFRVFVPLALTVSSVASVAVADVLIEDNTKKLSAIADSITPPSSFDGIMKYVKDFDFKKSEKSLENIFKCTASILAGFITKLVAIPFITIWLMVKLFTLAFSSISQRSESAKNG